MSRAILRANTAKAADIEAHLVACSNAFTPPLESRVSISEYSAKLAQFAWLSEAWADGRLVGLVAVYCNSPDRLSSFISNVSVEPKFRGAGLARLLIEQAVSHVRRLGFAQIELEAHAQAGDAIALYRSIGFHCSQERNSLTKLQMDLRG